MNTAGESWLQLTHVTAYALKLKAPNAEKRVVSAITVLHVIHGHLEVRSTVSTVAAGPGETVLCRPGIVYQFAPQPMEGADADPVVCHCAEIMFLLNGEVHPDALLVLPDKIGPSRGVGLAELIRELMDMTRFSGRHPLERLARKTEMANALLGHLFSVSDLCSEGPDLPQGPTLLHRIAAYCRDRISSGVTVDDMVAEAHVSRSAFYEYLKKETGLPPAEFLKKIRLEKSLELLRLPDCSIAQIAERVGFANQFHFSREFGKRYSIAPSQYRRTHRLAGNLVEETAKADALFDGMEYERAAHEYAAVMENHRGQELGQEACYRRGLSLYLAGDLDGAFEVWREIKGTRFEQRTDLRRCRFLFDRSQHEGAIELLGRLCASATGAVRSEALHLWSGFVNELVSRKNVVPLWEYLHLKERLFAREPETGRAAANGLFAMGRYLEASEVCPDNPFKCMVALRYAGKMEEIFRRYGNTELTDQLARTLFVMGRYEELLERYPDRAEHCVQALVRLGRASEAIERYPQMCGLALIATGAYQDVLAKLPNDELNCTEALYQLGRYKEALERCAGTTWLTCQTLLRLGRAEEVLEADPADESNRHLAATCIQGIEQLAGGRTDEGLRILDSLPSMTSKAFFWPYSTYEPQLVVPLAHSIAGDASHLERHYREITERLRFCCCQELWHDAGYVLGDLDDERFLAQPYRDGAEERLLFAQAMRADHRGDRRAAMKFYSQYLAQPDCLSHEIVKTYFARWRSGQTQFRRPRSVPRRSK